MAPCDDNRGSQGLATIFIDQLTVDTVIGVQAAERRRRQRVIIDVELVFDITAAAARDEVGKTLDYAAVARRITAFAEAAEYKLVETLVERLAGVVLAEFDASRVVLRVNKPGALANAAGAGVRIVRARANENDRGR